MHHTLTKEEIYTALNKRHSPETQKLLSAGNVAIAGLGGLGSNVAYALARIGVGHLHLIDFDVVDITNLNRQQYFMEHIGMYKTDALKSLLLRINPYLDIRTDCVKVTDDNLQELFADATIVCEAFDNPKPKQCWSMEFWNIFRRKSWYQQPEWPATEAAIPLSQNGS